MIHALRRLLRVPAVLAMCVIGTACTSSGTSTGIGIGAPQAPAALDDPAKKEIAMQLVSSAENSSLDWKAQYGYIEDIG
ncbi:chitosanase, partial [Streptomyces sp. NPDC001840]